jgi:hypothetical protein
LKREGFDGGQQARLKRVIIDLYSNQLLQEQFKIIVYCGAM